MNKTYKTVYNEHTQSWVAVPEIAKAQGKKSTTSRILAQAILLLPIVCLMPGYALGNYLAGSDVIATDGFYKQSVGVGESIRVGGQATALGNNVNATGWGSVAVGNDDVKDSTLSGYVFDGTFSKSLLEPVWYRPILASGVGATALGSQTYATGTTATALGARATATGNYASALTAYATAKGDHSIALGGLSNAGLANTDERAIAVGYKANATASDAIAIGSNTAANIAGSVALGSGSTVSTPTPTTGSTVNSINYTGFAGSSDNIKAFSIGTAGVERQIQNVAAGRISATSTDAVNGSQLYATQNTIGNLAKSTATALGGGAAVNADGTVTAPNYMVKSNAGTAVTTATAAKTVGEALDRHETRLVTVEDTVSKGIGFAATSGSVTRRLGETVGIKGANSNISTSVAGNDLLIKIADAPVFSGSVKAKGFDADNSKIINVAAGDVSATSTDAVTGAQLFNVKNTAETAGNTATAAKTTADSALNKATTNETAIGNLNTTVAQGLNFAADNGTENMALGSKITVAGDSKNVHTALDRGTIKVSLSDTPNFTSVTTGPVVMSATGLNLGGQKLSNVAAGTVASGSTDGVNGGQLYTTANNLATYLGGGATLSNGAVSAPDYKVGGVTYHSVGDALAATNRQAGTVVFVDSAGARVYRAADGQFYNTLNADGTGSGSAVDVNTLHHALLDPNGTVTAAGALSNVGAGRLDTDAANVSQLKTAVTALGGGAAVNADGTVTAPSYMVKTNAGTAVTPATAAKTVGEALDRHETRLVTVEGGLTDLSNSPITFSGNEGGSLPRKLGESMKIIGSGNNVITKVSGENIEIRLADSPTFTGMVSATGFDAGNAKITRVADAVVNTDAVNLGQLNVVKTDISKIQETAVKYDNNPDGSLNKNSITLAGSGGTVIKNLADGAVSATSKDAVNGSQLFNAKDDLVKTGFTLQAQDNNSVKKNLGEAVRVVGDGGNIGTSVVNGEIKIGMTASPTFGSLQLNPTGSGKITGLSAGTAASDAVNYSQLKPLADALGAPIDPTSGAVDVPTYTVAGSNYHTVGGAVGALGGELVKGLKLSANSGAPATTLPLGGTLDITAGSNTNVVLNGNKYTIDMVSAPTFTGKVTAQGGFDARGSKITGVAAGSTATDAVNYQQLKDVITSVTNTSAANITLTSPMVYMTTKAGSSAKSTVARANDGKFYDVNDVNADGSTKAGATAVTTPVHITAMNSNGSSTSPITLDNIAAGVADTDAVNKKQLSDTAAIFGGGAGIAADGSVTKPAYHLMGETYNNVGDVFNALNRGLVGTVVYTDNNGQRLTKVGGQFYKETDVNSDGTLIGTPSPVDTGKVRLAAIDIQHSTKNGGIILGNIKAGEADTDAVNVRQLKNMGLDITGGKPVVTYDGTTKDSITLGDIANTYNPTAGTGGVKITNLAEGKAVGDAVNFKQLSDVKTLADNAGKGWTLKVNNETGGETILPGASINVAAGDSNLSVTRSGSTLTIATTASPQFGAVSINPAGGGTITGLSNKTFDTATTTSGQAATEDQLKTVFDTLKTNINTTAANSVNYDGSGKDRVSLQGSAYTAATASKTGNITAITTAATGGTAITNLTNGAVNAASSDAVNGSQLFYGMTSVAERLGGNASIDANGMLNAPSYEVGGHSYNTVGDAVTALNRQTTVATYINAAGERVLRAHDGKYYQKLNADGTGDTSSGDAGIDATAVHHALLDASGNTQSPSGSVLSNVGAGKIAAGSTDAINGGQLYTLRQATANLLGTELNADGSYKSPEYTVNNAKYGNVKEAVTALNTLATSPMTFTGDSGSTTVKLGESLAVKGAGGGNITTAVTASGITINTVDSPQFGGITINAGGSGKITGVTAGTTDTDAVNKAQLDSVVTSIGNTDALAKKAITVTGNTGSESTTFNLFDKPTFAIIGGATADAAASSNNIQTSTTADGITIKMVDNPVFNGVVKAKAFEATDGVIGDIKMDGDGHITGLTNKTFEAENIVSGRAATEDQLKVLAGKMNDAVATAGENYVAYDPSTDKGKVTLGGLKADGTPAVAGGVILSNVKAGVNETDAVNVGQLLANRKGLAKILGTELDTGGTVIAPSYDVGGHIYDNVKDAFAATNRQAGTVAYVNADGVRVYKANDGKFYQQLNADGSGNTTGGDSGIDITANPAAVRHALIRADGSTTGASVLGNVGAGKIAADSTDAINGAQAYGAALATANLLGTTLNADGSYKLPEYMVNGVKHGNVKDAVTALNTLATSPITFTGDSGSPATVKLGESLAVKGGADGNITTTVTASGITINTSASPTFGGVTINAAGSGKITGVAVGTEDTDAVNKGQLDEIANSVGTASSFAVKYDTDASDPSKADTSKVTLAGTDGTTISNLKAGAISATSTDAINGSQLHATNTATASALGGGATVNADGTIKAPSYALGGNTFNNVGDALDNLDGRTTTNSTNIAGNTTSINAINKTLDEGLFSVSANGDAGAKVTKDAVIDFSSTDNNINISRDAQKFSFKLADDLNIAGSVKVGGTTLDSNGLSIVNGPSLSSTGIDAGNKVVTNVANGQAQSDAVNKGQLDEIANSVGTASSFAVKYDTDASDPSKADTSKVTLAGTDGTTISNLKAGAISATSTDAINGSQLHATNTATASALGGGATVNADGTIKAPSYALGGNTFNNVGDALGNLDGRTTTNSTNIAGNTTSINAINKTLDEGLFSVSANGDAGAKVTKDAVIDFSSTDNNINISRDAQKFSFKLADDLNIAGSVKVGGTVIKGNEITINGSKVMTESSIANIDQLKNAVQYDNDAHNKVTLGGAGATAPVALTNVKDGAINATSTDAVTGKQLHDTNTRVSAVEGKVGSLESQIGTLSDKAVSYDGADKGNLTLGGKNGTAIHNVADGVNTGDAVNKGQLDGTLSAAKKYTDGEINKLTNGFTGDLNEAKTNISNLQKGADGMFQVNQGGAVTAPKPTGANSLAGGSGALASAKDSMALGNAAQATAENSVALGTGSVADRQNTVSVGKEGGERQIINVARGTKGTDAVNVSQMQEMIGNIGGSLNQLNQNISKVNRNAQAGIAGVAAMANIPQVMKAGQKSIGLGTASYRGERAVSLGVSMSTDDGHWVFKGSASYDSQNRSVVGGGVSYIWE